MKKKSMIYILIAAMVTSLFSLTAGYAPGADAAKKPALNKKKATIKVGDKLKLKVKNNKKKVKWSTSKKKVATVTKKGVVKAKSAGKAKITAKIGKTKLTCRVTVKKNEDKKENTTPVQTGIKVASITFNNRYQIQVKLSGAQALTAANFTVKSRWYEHGKYIRTHTLQSVTTTDNINYVLELDDVSGLFSNTMVQITVTGLTGTGTEVKEEFYAKGTFSYEEETGIRLAKGEVCSEVIYFSNTFGNCALTSVTGYPAGLSYEFSSVDAYIRFFGTPTQTGSYTATVKVTDEFDNTITSTVYFVIGDETTLSAACIPMYSVVSADGLNTYTTSYYDQVVVTGGSGNYLYSIDGESYGLTINAEGIIEGEIKTPGTYSLNIKVTDDANPSLTTTCKLTVNVTKAKAIKGTVRDASGAAVQEGVTIYFDSNNKGDIHYGTGGTYTNNKGEYTALLCDGTYTAYTFVNGVKSVTRTITVSADMTGVDFVIPTYRHVLQYDGPAIEGYAYWTDVKTGKSYDSYDNIICLPEGTYNLSFEREDGLIIYSATINNLVVTASSVKTMPVTVTAFNKLGDSLKGEMGMGAKTVTFGEAGEFMYYKFVPTTTMTYYFTSNGSADTRGVLLDEKGELLIEDEDSGIAGINYSFSYECVE